MNSIAPRKFVFAALLLLVVSTQLAFALSSMRVPAVDAGGEGILTSASVDVNPGTGEEYVNIVPFFSIETQQSSKAAITAATALAKVDRKDYDFFVKIVANAEVVDGPSGGAALGVLTYAELTGKRIRSDLAVTGSITSDGGIGKVGGIFKKAEAAAKAGIKVLVVPPDQSVQDGVDLTTYGPTKWGMQVLEARKLADVIKVAFTTEGSKVEQPENKQLPLILEKLNETSDLSKFKNLAAGKLLQARAAIEALKTKDANAPLINYSLRDLNTSAYQLEQGYYYSAANNAFLAIVGVQAYSLANRNKQDALAQLSQMEAQARALNVTAKTTANLEWAFAAELRKYWALQRLDEARDKAAGQTDPAILAQNLAAAQNWISSVSEFNEIAVGILGGTALDESKLRGAAAKAIASASNESAASPDSEGDFHLATARKAFSQGAYLAAYVDAVFARSFAIAVKKHADKTTQEALAATNGTDYYYSLKSSWAKLYFSHALYSKAEFERTGDASALLNALKLQELAGAIEQLVSNEIPRELGAPVQQGEQQIPLAQGNGNSTGEAGSANGSTGNKSGQGTMEISVITLPRAQAGFDSRHYIAGALIALVIAITALIYGIQSRKEVFAGTPQAQAGDLEKKLERLDEMLLEGKLGERNYDRLKQKYEGQYKQAKEVKPSTGLQAKAVAQPLKNAAKTPARKSSRNRR